MSPSILTSSSASAPGTSATSNGAQNNNSNGIGSSLFGGRSFFSNGSTPNNGSNGIMSNHNPSGHQVQMNNNNPSFGNQNTAASPSTNSAPNNFMMSSGGSAVTSPMSNSAGGAAGSSGVSWGGGGVLPNVGEQMDMNVLWELVTQLAEVNQGIREQTQGVLHRVQMIQARTDEARRDGDAPLNATGNGAEANGPVSPLQQNQQPQPSPGILTPEDATALLSTRAAIWTLLTDHEQALSTLLARLRPFAQQNLEALHAQRAHYTSLLDTERTANLELRVEIARLQEGLGRALGMARKALEAQGEQSAPWRRRIAALRAENKVLRGICNLPEPEGQGWSDEGESSSGEEDDDLHAHQQQHQQQGGIITIEDDRHRVFGLGSGGGIRVQIGQTPVQSQGGNGNGNGNGKKGVVTLGAPTGDAIKVPSQQ